MDSNRFRATLLAVVASVVVGCGKEQQATVADGDGSKAVSSAASSCEYFYVEVFDSLFPLPSNMVAQTWVPDSGDSTLLFVSRGWAGQKSDPSAIARAKFTQFATERKIESAYPSEVFELLDSKLDGDIHSWTYRFKRESSSSGAGESTYSFVASSSQYRVEILSSNAKLGRGLFDKFLKLRSAVTDDLPRESECLGQ